MTLDIKNISGGIENAAIVTLIEPGRTGGIQGAKMLVTGDAFFGDLGSELLNLQAAKAGRAALDDGYVRVCRVPAGEEEQQAARLLVDPYVPPLELLVLGAGHIARPLARLGSMLGYEVTVVDDRPEFASRERFPEASRIICGDFIEVLRGMAIGKWTFVVIVTRGHRHDYHCLAEVIERPAGYIGMIGSKRKVRLIREQLLKDGYGEDKVDRVHMPIGLDIGARTPEEIALSIAAEMVKARRGGTAPSLARNAAGAKPPVEGEARTGRDLEVMREALALARSGTRAAVVTITEAGGSTPRKTGARMAVLETGGCLGTVGGGAAESAAVNAAMEVIATGRPQLLKFNLDAESAAAEGMACGGAMELFIEPIALMQNFLEELSSRE